MYTSMFNSDDNEKKIVAQDTSIIQSNEHPKFKIGDVINNGYGDFIVKGYTRSFLGLGYVLDNGHKLIGWLTEQVDAKCHLVEQKQSMKINAPKKIYLFENPITETPDDRWLSKRSDKNDIEYIQTDVFIDDTISWLKEQDEMIGVSFPDDFLERFRNHMKGE